MLREIDLFLLSQNKKNTCVGDRGIKTLVLPFCCGVAAPTADFSPGPQGHLLPFQLRQKTYGVLECSPGLQPGVPAAPLQM